MTDYIDKALGETQEVTPREWLKSCGCGANYSYTSWNALPLLGITEMGPDEEGLSWLEQRNCSKCNSTLAVEWGQEENAHHRDGEDESHHYCNAGMGGESCAKCEAERLKEEAYWSAYFGVKSNRDAAELERRRVVNPDEVEEEINQDLRDSGRGYLASDK